MDTQPELILASASPRRHDILTSIGVPHQVVLIPNPSDTDEPQIPGESPVEYVRRTAQEKAEQAADFLLKKVGEPAPSATLPEGHAKPEGLYILCADTCVILDDTILGKPENTAHATHMLRALSGREHTVITAVSLWHENRIHMTESRTQVQFSELTDADIAAYCATKEHMGKAGAYGIQGYAARFVSHLSGSYTGVVGLPAWETIELLREARFPI